MTTRTILTAPARRARSVLFACLLASPVSQAQIPALWEVDLTSPGPPSGTVGRTVSGRLTGDGRPDLALLAGDEVRIVSAPAVYDVSSSLDDTSTFAFTGVGVMPDPGSTTDRLFTLSDQGLTEWVFSPASARFDPTPIDPGLVGATSLCIADFDGDGRDDIACVGAPGDRLVLLMANVSGGFETASSTPVGGQIVEVASVKWAGPTTRIALVTAEGRIQIRDTSTELVTFDTSDEHVAFTAFSTVGKSSEELAWVTENASTGEQWFNVVAPQTGVTPTIYLGLAGVAPGALERGRVDGDEHEDVTMTFATIPNIVTLFNQGVATPPFDAGSGITFPYAVYGYDTGIQEAEPRLFDLDNDGDNDYALARQELADVRLTRNGYTVPQTFGLFSYQIDEPTPPMEPGWGPTDGQLYIHVSTPYFPSALATHYEFEVWHVTGNDEIEPQRVGYLAIPIDEEETEAEVYIRIADFYVDSAETGFRPDYYVLVREVGPNHAGTDTIIDLIDVICPGCTSSGQQLPNPIRFPGGQTPIPPPGSPYGST